jgi:hypothetical protein
VRARRLRFLRNFSPRFYVFQAEMGAARLHIQGFCQTPKKVVSHVHC